MNTNTQIDKIDKVLSKISGKEIKAFAWQYAATHEDFATALVEKYWKPERGNYKEQVEACFAHAGVLGKRFGQPQLYITIPNKFLAVSDILNVFGCFNFCYRTS